jgi:mRNA-degrading endonuclease RelE of RelBE toxin-antitoxin system
MNRLVIANSALREIRELTGRDRQTVVSTLERLQRDPTRDVIPDPRAGLEDLPAITMAPAGDFRIYFRYLEDASLVQILVVAKKPERD